VATIITRTGKGSPLTNTEMDDNFSNLNTDKYESGDDVDFGSITSSGDFQASADTSVSAAGTVQGDATLLTKTYNIVTTATTNQGVILPDPTGGLKYTIANASGNNIKIYPAVGDSINSGTANDPITVPTGATKDLIGTSVSNWDTLVELPIYDSTGTRLN